MAFEDYQTKASVVVVFTGEGKGKTTASLGLTIRALGAGWRVAYIQFIKHWTVNEHKFIEQIEPIFNNRLLFIKGGRGFYKAGDLSAPEVSEQEHRQAAIKTYQQALTAAKSGKYELVVCDEINNAVHDGLLSDRQLDNLITNRSANTSLCLTGRNFPDNLIDKADIVTSMTKLKHHFDEKFLANNGIDF